MRTLFIDKGAGPSYLQDDPARRANGAFRLVSRFLLSPSAAPSTSAWKRVSHQTVLKGRICSPP